MTKVAIIGSGGHTRSSINLLKVYFDERDMSIYDDSFKQGQYEVVGSTPLVGCVDDISYKQYVFLSIGENNLRKTYFLKFEEKVIKENIFHTYSLQEMDVKFGESNQLFAHSYINSQVKIGDNNIINSGAIIKHKSPIETLPQIFAPTAI